MERAMLLTVTIWMGISVSVALAGSSSREISDPQTTVVKSLNDESAPRQYAFGLDSGKAWYQNAGKWACMARSTYGTHGTTTVWSAYTSSRTTAERSALEKCNVSAVNKQDCRVSRCWIESGE